MSGIGRISSNDYKFYLVPLNLPTDTSLYSWTSTLCPASGCRKQEHVPGPSMEGDLICPNVFPDLLLRIRESIVMLHTATKLKHYNCWNGKIFRVMLNHEIIYQYTHYSLHQDSLFRGNQKLRVPTMVYHYETRNKYSHRGIQTGTYPPRHQGHIAGKLTAVCRQLSNIVHLFTLTKHFKSRNPKRPKG